MKSESERERHTGRGLIRRCSSDLCLLTPRPSVSDYYTIDERLCFLADVMDISYVLGCFCFFFRSVLPMWALSVLLSRAIVNCGFVAGPTMPELFFFFVFFKNVIAVISRLYLYAGAHERNTQR